MTEPKRFAGHGVLVTGAARGTGVAVARRLAEEGARVLPTHQWVGWETPLPLGVPDAEATAGGAEERAVPGVALACLEQVVVDVLDADLGADPAQAEGLQLLHHQGAGRVLGPG